MRDRMNEGQVNYSTERTISSQNLVSADDELAGNGVPLPGHRKVLDDYLRASGLSRRD